MSTANQKRLHDFLRDAELGNRTFSVEDAAKAAGQQESTVRTYLVKKLKGSWVEPVDGIGGVRYRVKGIAAMSWPEFQRLMSQKAQPATKDQTQWMLDMRRLIEAGLAAGYPVAEIIQGMLASARRAP